MSEFSFSPDVHCACADPINASNAMVANNFVILLNPLVLLWENLIIHCNNKPRPCPAGVCEVRIRKLLGTQQTACTQRAAHRHCRDEFFMKFTGFQYRGQFPITARP
jgi:hypothetical protein